jgi:hypothetical protein
LKSPEGNGRDSDSERGSEKGLWATKTSMDEVLNRVLNELGEVRRVGQEQGSRVDPQLLERLPAFGKLVVFDPLDGFHKGPELECVLA